ncbi:MAG: S-methyl-5-thioribose-1-phosphate isomerase [Syntrophobacterales bacterium]|nr:S-methyl-5-thioribose-1-phosphate isomerase [Syntrophobacterales bacterium]
MNGGLEVRPIFWDGDTCVILDQRYLPQEEKYIRCSTAEEVIDAIKNMAIRGAPAVGLAGAAAVALGARTLLGASGKDAFFKGLNHFCDVVRKARPTGYNLEWAVEVMRSTAVEHVQDSIEEIVELLRNKAKELIEEDVAINRNIGRWGKTVIPQGARILTYCNAGSLATGGYGTALGVIRAAWEEDRTIQVFACETRPYLQGARLTVYELMKDGIPVVLITDNTAGYLMQKRRIDVIVVGADRIAANGDVANKIGTYTLAVLAKHHGIPFFVAAPRSTIDPRTPKGDSIVIEERPSKEVTSIGKRPIAPKDTRALYIAFDVTPHRYISGIITEVGIIVKPFSKNLKEALFK